MRHAIMGTAGHVDHGKTALIRALTGIDCDTHAEEKRRGITISLGFAHLELPSGASIGIVDVPGHRDFVHTMVGGASGIDFALLAVAADSGVMPQTTEHLQIMDMLGISTGLTALTKIDLVDEEMRFLAGEEVRQAIKGTFLAHGPVLPVSARTGAGLDALRRALDDLATAVRPRPAEGPFRMFIDRIFTVSGFGSIVTGSVISGSLRIEDNAYLLPRTAQSQACRVRRLERHGREVDAIVAGDRAAVNLAGLDKSEFRRGMLLSDTPLQPTTLLDVSLQLFPQSPPLGLWSQAMFQLGTYEAQTRVHLIDCDQITGGGSAVAQIALPAPCCALHGDRFVIRTSSGDTTLGGGSVLDPHPLHHRRRRTRVVTSLHRLAGAGPEGLIFETIRKSPGPLSHTAIAAALHLPPDAVRQCLKTTCPDDITCLHDQEATLAATKQIHDQCCTTLLQDLQAYHRAHPLEPGGRTLREIAGILHLNTTEHERRFVALLLQNLAAHQRLKSAHDTWALTEHAPHIDADMQAWIAFATDYLESCGMQTPHLPDMEAAAQKKGLAGFRGKAMQTVLKHLVRTKTAYRIEDSYVWAPLVDQCREQLVAALETRPDGLTLAEFRDLVGGNRKICLLMVSLFDAEKLTRRVGDRRVLARRNTA